MDRRDFITTIAATLAAMVVPPALAESDPVPEGFVRLDQLGGMQPLTYSGPTNPASYAYRAEEAARVVLVSEDLAAKAPDYFFTPHAIGTEVPAAYRHDQRFLEAAIRRCHSALGLRREYEVWKALDGYVDARGGTHVWKRQGNVTLQNMVFMPHTSINDVSSVMIEGGEPQPIKGEAPTLTYRGELPVPALVDGKLTFPFDGRQDSANIIRVDHGDGTGFIHRIFERNRFGLIDYVIVVGVVERLIINAPNSTMRSEVMAKVDDLTERGVIAPDGKRVVYEDWESLVTDSPRKRIIVRDRDGNVVSGPYEFGPPLDPKA